MPEIEIPWSLVAESDEVYSTKLARWYTIRSVVASVDGTTVKIQREGVKGFNTVKSADTVRVRRGATGQAVDTFRVIFSGPTSREA